MEKETEKYETKKKNMERKTLIRLTGVAVIILLLVLGLSRAWFVSQNNIATLVQVTAPSEISLRGPHGEALTELDMSYSDEDKDSNGKVTIRRVISVKSTSRKHKLEIVHTTNMKDLSFTIYPATETDSGQTKISEDGYSYSYDSNNKVTGGYINVDKDENGYKYADAKKYHNNNYGNYENVQTHVEPVYWLSSVQTGVDRAENTEALDYYVIEISWTETTKETDMFYILVKNA